MSDTSDIEDAMSGIDDEYRLQELEDFINATQNKRKIEQAFPEPKVHEKKRKWSNLPRIGEPHW